MLCLFIVCRVHWYECVSRLGCWIPTHARSLRCLHFFLFLAASHFRLREKDRSAFTVEILNAAHSIAHTHIFLHSQIEEEKKLSDEIVERNRRKSLHFKRCNAHTGWSTCNNTSMCLCVAKPKLCREWTNERKRFCASPISPRLIAFCYFLELHHAALHFSSERRSKTDESNVVTRDENRHQSALIVSSNHNSIEFSNSKTKRPHIYAFAHCNFDHFTCSLRSSWTTQRYD